MSRVLLLRSRILARLNDLAWNAPTLIRLAMGALFLSTGWGKLHSLDKVTTFFTDLGIPAPAFQAHLVAATEFLGGTALIAGLGTRLAAAPLAVTMVVAILTAKRDDIASLSDFVGLDETAYLLMLISLVFTGAGPLSLDRLVARSLGGAAATSASPTATSDRAVMSPAISA